AASEKRVCGWKGLFKGLHRRSVYAVGRACSRGCIGEACMRLEGPVQGAASEKRVCGWKGLFKGLHQRSVYAVGWACSGMGRPGRKEGGVTITSPGVCAS